MAFIETFKILLIYIKQFDTGHVLMINKNLLIIQNILNTKKAMNLLNKAVNVLKFLMHNVNVLIIYFLL